MMEYLTFSADSGRPPLRLIIVDDVGAVRIDLRQFLELQPGLVVVGEASDGLEALELVRKIHPDVVLMDLEMPGLDGCEATRIIHSEGMPVRIIILSIHSDHHVIDRALAAGAEAFVQKGEPIKNLLKAIYGDK